MAILAVNLPVMLDDFYLVEVLTPLVKQKNKVDCFVKTRKFDLIDIIDEALNLQPRYFFKGIKHQLLISRGFAWHFMRHFSRGDF